MIKSAKKSFFIIQQIQKNRKCPALNYVRVKYTFAITKKLVPSIAQLVERWTVGEECWIADIHRSLVRFRLEGRKHIFINFKKLNVKIDLFLVHFLNLNMTKQAWNAKFASYRIELLYIQEVWTIYKIDFLKNQPTIDKVASFI